MITRIMNKTEVIKRLEYLQCESEYIANGKGLDEKAYKDAIALKAAVYYLKEKKKDDIYIVKATITLTTVLLILILLWWNMV